MWRRSLVWRTMTSAYWSRLARWSLHGLLQEPAQALGRELDRGERVLDLVGDAPGDVAPGGHTLRHDEVGDVVEADDTPSRRRRRHGGRDPHQQVASRARCGAADLGLADAGLPGIEPVEQGREFRHRLGQGLGGEPFGSRARSATGGGVHHLDATEPVEADDASRHAGQDQNRTGGGRSVELVGGDQGRRWPFTWRSSR